MKLFKNILEIIAPKEKKEKPKSPKKVKKNKKILTKEGHKRVTRP